MGDTLRLRAGLDACWATLRCGRWRGLKPEAGTIEVGTQNSKSGIATNAWPQRHSVATPRYLLQCLDQTPGPGCSPVSGAMPDVTCGCLNAQDQRSRLPRPGWARVAFAWLPASPWKVLDVGPSLLVRWIEILAGASCGSPRPDQTKTPCPAVFGAALAEHVTS